MAYAEKHGRGWRARWRDANGSLRSASGFGSRVSAEEYGRDREQGLRVYSFTRGQLIRALRSDAVCDAIADALMDKKESTP